VRSWELINRYNDDELEALREALQLRLGHRVKGKL